MNEPDKNKISRSKFFMRISLLVGGAAAAAVSVPVVGAILAPLLERKREAWRTVGAAGEFEVGSTNLVKFINADPKPYAGVTTKSAAWLRRKSDEEFIAFSANCSHLGCPVRWEKDAELFMCPCHGGVYYKDGTVAAGPPPKGLTQYQVRIANGEVQLLTAPLPLTTVNASKER